MVRIGVLTGAGIAGLLALCVFLHRQRVREEWGRAEERNATVAERVTASLESAYERARLDLELLSGLESLGSAVEHPTEEGWVSARRDFGAFARSRPDYFQVRFIDPQGRERIRFDRVEKRILPAEVLQDKSDRYYFREMIGHPEGTVYVSPLDWNIEYGQIEVPKRPTVRFGIRLPEGLVVLNADARVLCRVLLETSVAFHGTIRVADRKTGTVLVRASEGTWEFLPGPTGDGRDEIVREASAGEWVVRAATLRSEVVDQAMASFREHLLLTTMVAMLMVLAALLAVRSGRRAAQLEQERRDADRIRAANLELRRTRELLVERTRLATLGEMVPALAHEIRNPLQSMLTAARTLREDVTGPEGRELLEILTGEIARLDRIATDFLFRRGARNGETSDPVSLTRRVVELLCAGRSEGRIPVLDLKLPESAPRVLFPPDAFQQVLWNLLRNACEAAGPEGRVWIRLTVAAERVRFEIEDDGPGLGAPKTEGHGIGLSLCDQLLRMHEGTLDLGPSTHGGAKAAFTLPVAVGVEVGA